MFGRKNGCRYFIDSENVNEVWVNILNILKPEDMIFLFYTDNSAHISCAKAVELINIGAKQIKGIRCKEGNNGLDFQMVTQLGAVISKSPKCEYILISNDNGFDAVVSYWKQKGYNIRREKSSFCVSLQISDPEKPTAAQKRNSNTNRRQNSGQRYQNRPRLENRKDYKKPMPKLEDKTQQTVGGKTYDNKAYENKTYGNKTYENKTSESKTYDGKANGSKPAEGRSSAGKAADNRKASDDRTAKDRASDNQKVVDLEAKKARKLEEKKHREKTREAEAEKKNRAAASEEALAQDVTATETVREEAVPQAEAVGEATVMEAKATWTENGMETETVREQKLTQDESLQMEPVQVETAMEDEAEQTEYMMEQETAQEETAQEHDDFEPMEKPMAIPDTAMVADGSRTIDTRYCLQSLCTMISRKNMALFHNALTCIFEQKDGDEIYAAVKSHPELHAQLWIRYEQDREERVRMYLRLLLDVNDYEVQDTDLLYQVYRETYDGSLQGLNIGIMKAFGDETGVKYYRLLRKHINILTKL